MEYYVVFKTDKKVKLEKRLVLTGGYTFRKSNSIALYNQDLIEYILTKKLNNSLRKIINLYLLAEEDEETGDERKSELLPQIETLRNVLLDRYARFLNTRQVESYLSKLEKMEIKLSSTKMKKSRSR